MALYDYRCSGGHVTEARRRMNCEAILCPQCGKTAQRVVVNKGIHIIGETVAKGGR